MAIKAYLMINANKGFCQNGRMEDRIAELEAIPEVKCIEKIDGACDFLIQIEAPIRAVFTVNKVRALDWIQDLRLLKVEPFHIRGHKELAVPEVLKLRRRTKSKLVAEAEQHIAAAVSTEQRVETKLVEIKGQ